MEFQKYNVKEKKKEKKERKTNKQSHKNYKENIGTKLITNTKKQKLKIDAPVSRVLQPGCWLAPVHSIPAALKKHADGSAHTEDTFPSTSAFS